MENSFCYHFLEENYEKNKIYFCKNCFKYFCRSCAENHEHTDNFTKINLSMFKDNLFELYNTSFKDLNSLSSFISLSENILDIKETFLNIFDNFFKVENDIQMEIGENSELSDFYSESQKQIDSFNLIKGRDEMNLYHHFIESQYYLHKLNDISEKLLIFHKDLNFCFEEKLKFFFEYLKRINEFYNQQVIIQEKLSNLERDNKKLLNINEKLANLLESNNSSNIKTEEKKVNKIEVLPPKPSKPNRGV
ncbi:MAG: hypothetical protein MJ252_03220, partial [archaeon]|nr:hypothetical protein [archaeon]